jgi:deoxyribodipyrimidine photolyase-related protein
MKTLRIILGDQLSPSISALSGLDRETDVILMMEVENEITQVKHHKQKVVLVLSAMRHFAAELRDRGLNVDYVRLDDPLNTQSFDTELRRAVKRHEPENIVVTEAGEWRVREAQEGWQAEVRKDDRFLADHAEFARWAEGRIILRMDHFYRQMRKKTGWLMDGGAPPGGNWSYDAQNRKTLPADIPLPQRLRFSPDAVTQEVLDLVRQRFPEHFGELDGYGWAVSRAEALDALEHFIRDCLQGFGDFQDAMKTNESYLFHALLSPYLNIGLLLPREICEAILAVYERGDAPLAAVEGFIRQIAGWREFIRGIYWLRMPEYRESNFLNADRELPAFYWTGDTEMECLRQAISTTRRNAYAHHIQRLMVTGNFALLAGLDPARVEEWYLMVYADAFEWVELPNTHGMALYADGGVIGSKPYAASGSYINRMSDYCGGCPYDPRKKEGETACPFNLLYWNFLMVNESRLRSNPRMALTYRNVDRLDDRQKKQLARDAEAFLTRLDPLASI